MEFWYGIVDTLIISNSILNKFKETSAIVILIYVDSRKRINKCTNKIYQNKHFAFHDLMEEQHASKLWPSKLVFGHISTYC